MKVDNLKEAFSFFDRKGLGFFTLNDFKAILCDQASNVNHQNIVTEAFPGLLKITFEDFRNFMVNTQA